MQFVASNEYKLFDQLSLYHSPNAVSMLAHRLRRWPNIETALGDRKVFCQY